MAENSRFRSEARFLLTLALPALLAPLAFSGCEAPTRSWLLEHFEAYRTAQAPTPSARPPSPLPSESVTARQVRANAELLQEMLSVVTLKAPVDASRFGNIVDTMNQGASLEGIYNGLVHSADYRGQEEGYFGSSAEALDAFAVQLAYVEAAFPKPREFDGSATHPLAMIDPTDLSPSQSLEPVMRLPAESAKDVKALAIAYRKHFAGASVYILKRVLADEALRLIALKQTEGPKALQEWYGEFVERAAELKVDFGLPLRSRADRAWHVKWAETAGMDRLEWEVLNRLHRIVNAGETKRKGKPG